MAFKTIINLLLCLDGMNNAFDWSSEEYRCHEKQLIDPSFAYGITYYNVHGALSRQGKTSTDCHRIAHQTASKKVSRLINEGGYKLDNTKMREAVRFIHKMGSVPDDEVRKMMNDLENMDIRRDDELRSDRSRELFKILMKYIETPVSHRSTFSTTEFEKSYADEFNAELKRGSYSSLIDEMSRA